MAQGIIARVRLTICMRKTQKSNAENLQKNTNNNNHRKG